MSTLTTNRVYSAIIVAIMISLPLVLMRQAHLFQSAQLTSTNLYYVSKDVSDKIVIVTLDDASLGRFGRSPSEWSRTVYADLIEQLGKANVRVIAFDLLFSEATEDDNLFAEAVEKAREDDKGIRIVVAGAGVGIPEHPDKNAIFPNALNYENVLLPIDSLAASADYIGFVNTLPDVDTFIRHQPSIIYHNQEANFSFSIASYLAYLRISSSLAPQVVSSDSNFLYVTPERPLPVDANGFWLQNFFGTALTSTRHTFQTVSLVDVLDGKVDMSIFNDKIVLIGLATIAGDADRYPVPSEPTGGQMSGIEIQANAIETLLSNRLLAAQSPIAQTLTIIGLSLLTSLLCALPRWYWKLLIAAALLVCGLILALIIFNGFSIVSPLLYPTAAIALTTIVHIGLDSNREFQLRRRADFLLETVSELTEQQMEMKTILPHIAKNLQILLPGSSGAIYIQAIPNTELDCLYYWPDLANLEAYDKLVESIKTEDSPMLMDIHLGIPIWWQGNLLAIIVVSHALAQRRLVVLKDFANKLAPIIYGTLLYKALNKQNNTLSAVLSNTPSIVLVLDLQQRVQLYSTQATNLLDNGDLNGKSIVTVFESIGIESDLQSKILSQMQSTQYFEESITLEAKSYELEAAYIESLQQWVLALNDVTDLVELSKLKTRMIRMASHDLKNPLGRISGYIQLIKAMSMSDDKLMKYLHPIEHAAEEMNQLIADLLNLERTRSGRQDMERFSLREVVEQVVSRHGPDALQKKQNYHAELSSKSLNMLGDLRQISQVVSNLIGNAIKYTPEGGSIDIRLHSDQNTIRFEVQDTGYGIPKEAQEKLFTEFYRVRSKETANIAGTGLGLSLVKSVIESHKGQVGVISEENMGSTFYFTLPNQEGMLNA